MSQPPAPPSSSAWLRTLLVLTANTAVAGVLMWTGSRSFATAFIYSQCIGLCIWAAVDGGRVLIARLLKRTDHPREAELDDGWPGWPWMAALILLGTPGGFFAGGALAHLITGAGLPLHGGLGGQTLGFLLALSLLAALTVTLTFHLRGVMACRAAELAQAQRLASEARLRLLESQLEPHMLFNTLANLRALIGVDPARAQAMLDHLIAYLRATLGASRVARHPLRAEFDRLADYLALMQVRMGSRLRVHMDLPEPLTECPLPPLLLQPLVENAIRHGLEPSVEGGEIRVGAQRAGDDLVLTVQDSGQGLRPVQRQDGTGTGFGLTQIRERLANTYGAAAGLMLEPVPAGGTRATVRIPWSGLTQAADGMATP